MATKSDASRPDAKSSPDAGGAKHAGGRVPTHGFITLRNGDRIDTVRRDMIDYALGRSSIRRG